MLNPEIEAEERFKCEALKGRKQWLVCLNTMKQREVSR